MSATLRIAPDWMVDQLQAAGLRVERHEQGAMGMWVTVAIRPS